jgi:hypothetical protein
MSGLLAVARREIQERGFLLPVAAAAGVLPLLLQLLAPHDSALETGAEFLALVLLAAVPLAVAVALGSSVLGRDLAERRLSFYFTRPLGGFAIWGGKMLAALLLTLATTAVLLALSFRFLMSRLPSGENAKLPIALAVAVPLLGLVVTQVLASLFRSRSGLIQYDAAAFVACAAAVAVLAKVLLEAGARVTLHAIVLPKMAFGLLVACALAGAAQVIVGRTDTRRGHLALSGTLWGFMAALILAESLFVHWVLAVEPKAGRYPQTGASPSGDYFFFANGFPSRAGYHPRFLMNARTGRFVNVGNNFGWIWSADGRYAAWVERTATDRLLALARLDGPAPTITRTSLLVAGWPRALSADATRVLTTDREGTRAGETDTGRLVAETRVVDVLAGSFLARDKVRLYHASAPAGSHRAIVISDWDLGTGVVVERCRIGERFDAVIHDVRGGGLLVEERSSRSRTALALYDAESGRRERTLAEEAARIDVAAWLRDGRALVVTSRGSEKAQLHVFDESGKETRSKELPHRNVVWVGEVGSHVVLGSFDPPMEMMVHALFVDMQSGDARLDASLCPTLHHRDVIESQWNGHDDPSIALAADALVPRLFYGRDGGLYFFDAETGEKRTLLPTVAR